MLSDYGQFARCLGVLLAVGGAIAASGVLPPNPVIGVRLRESFASKRAWYVSNRIGGLLLLGNGALLWLVGWLLRHTPPPSMRGAQAVALLAPLLPVWLAAPWLKRVIRRAILEHARE